MNATATATYEISTRRLAANSGHLCHQCMTPAIVNVFKSALGKRVATMPVCEDHANIYSAFVA